ncbi:MAG: 2,3-diaminopropionate biosynthesis protein SbnB [Nostochopsis sp.]
MQTNTIEQNFSVISGSIINKILQSNYAKVIDLVESAYLAHGEKKTVNPDSYFLKYPDKPEARVIALPAYLGGDFNISGIKWIASFPKNINHGIPRASAVIILNDYETGYPIACLEGSIISASRTAASAVLAAQNLIEPKIVKKLGIIGTGLISRYVLNFLLNTGWTISALNLFDLNDQYSEAMKNYGQERGIEEVHISSTKEELISASDLITLTTTAGEPHIEDASVFAHNPIVLHLSLRDLSPNIILTSNNIVDDVDHCLKAATSLHLTEQEVGNREFVTGTIDQLVQGKLALDSQKPTIYSPFGMGILDLAVASYVYQMAVLEKTTVTIPDFFNEETRI